MSRLRLTLRQLQSFVAVARQGSTSGAAQATALSQSATSAALSELERLLGLLLFDRVGKRLLLNDNGLALLARAEALLDGAASIEQMANDSDTRSLRIGASSTIGNHILPRFLRSLLPAQPHSGKPLLRVQIGNSESICAALAAFELDIGLIEGPSHYSELQATPWLADELVLVAAPNFIKLNTPLNIDTLREAVWLLREPGSGTREMTDQLLLAHLGQYRHCIELGSSEALLNAAAQGLGLACLSHWVVQNALQQGQLVKLNTPLPPLRRQCFLVIHRQKIITGALQHFIQRAQDWSQH
ncbi:transcriptional regulator [Ventosimonas gracilis]|uniref:Transcriptional regulator n=1 Tax=Ventosimonas gracilis TaxID=1680762 RepID=A0A139SNT3_9GAMM|nr:LysR family transcriptional regulator [Ventosimonas gracilis]KXU36130.1 transcriptional regulator [Ventosimonas gracilis]